MHRFSKAVRLLCIYTTIVGSLSISGCSDLPYLIGLEPTGLRSDGSYTPFAAERSYDCVELRAQIAGEEKALVGADKRALAQLKAGSTTLGTWFWRTTSGSVSGLPAVRDFNTGSARLDALELLWREKGCPERQRSLEVLETTAKLAKLIEQHEAKSGQ